MKLACLFSINLDACLFDLRFRLKDTVMHNWRLIQTPSKMSIYLLSLKPDHPSVLVSAGIVLQRFL